MLGIREITAFNVRHNSWEVITTLSNVELDSGSCKLWLYDAAC